MADYDSFDDRRVKHLELVQGVITRLGNNGFLVKGWALTITVALLGVAVNSTDWRLSLVAIIPSLVFWGLDAYFLQAERLFRALYDEIARLAPGIEPFEMGATGAEFKEHVGDDRAAALTWWSVLLRPVLRSFYLALVASAGLVAFILCRTT